MEGLVYAVTKRFENMKNDDKELDNRVARELTKMINTCPVSSSNGNMVITVSLNVVFLNEFRDEGKTKFLNAVDRVRMHLEAKTTGIVTDRIDYDDLIITMEGDTASTQLTPPPNVAQLPRPVAFGVSSAPRPRPDIPPRLKRPMKFTPRFASRGDMEHPMNFIPPFTSRGDMESAGAPLEFECTVPTRVDMDHNGNGVNTTVPSSPSVLDAYGNHRA